MKVQSRDRRVYGFLTRHLKKTLYRWEGVTDRRARRGRRWQLCQLLNAALFGLFCASRTLRDVEALTDELGRPLRRYIPRRVPDTTLYQNLDGLDVEQLREKLREQVYGLWRSKCLKPEGLPCGVLSIDGKAIGTLDHDAEGTAQQAHRAHDGSTYYLGRVLRAVLTSTPARACLDQEVVPAETNEMGAFKDFFEGLLRHFGGGDLFEIVTVDAGLCSRANAELVHQAARGYVMALKQTQPELYAEAERLLKPQMRREPAAEVIERERGMQYRRKFYRTTEIAGWHGWRHLKQAWMVVKQVRSSEGDRWRTVELRYFLTNLRPGRLTAQQSLQVVRNHWGIENDCFWSLDAQWREDDLPWSRAGRAAESIAVLRLMAYNLMQLLRKKHLRLRLDSGERAEPPAWRSVFEWAGQALRLQEAGAVPVHC